MTHLVLTLSADHGHGAALRANVRLWLAEQSVSTETTQDVVLAISELFSNAVRATEGEHTVRVGLHLNDDELLLAVSNTGDGFNPDLLQPAEPQQCNGRGIAIVRSLGDLWVHQVRDRTVVCVAMNTSTGPIEAARGRDLEWLLEDDGLETDRV